MTTDKILEQVNAIRDTGLTNMFDYQTVQKLAFEHDFHELVCFIEEDRKGYFDLIFCGGKKYVRRIDNV